MKPACYYRKCKCPGYCLTWVHLSDDSGCSFTSGGQKLHCFSAFSSPSLHAQGCDFFRLQYLDLTQPPQELLLGAWEPRNFVHCFSTACSIIPGGHMVKIGSRGDAPETGIGQALAVWDLGDSEPRVLHCLVCKLLVPRRACYVSLLELARLLK